MDKEYLVFAIVLMSVANYLTRAFPFLFFIKHSPPKFVLFIEENFPPIIMTILIIYSLSGVDFEVPPYGAKEISAVIITALLHFRFGNYLVSIFIGTLFYMFLVQVV